MDKKIFSAAVAAFMIACSFGASAQSAAWQKAMEMYRGGMYSTARTLFLDSATDGQDALAEGYALLCDMKMSRVGYEAALGEYFTKYPESALYAAILHQHGLNLFDLGDYEGAKRQFMMFPADALDSDQAAEFAFKKAYCDFELGNTRDAKAKFAGVLELPFSDYTAPSHYSMGYIYYSEQDFRRAEAHFAESLKDPRFEEASAYYILECRFMDKDYRYVVENGEKMLEKLPPERQTHLARLMSESYLVLGDVQKARNFYDMIIPETGLRTRGDYFYAGSVLYAVKDFQGAIDCYTKMADRTDSIGQVANYNLAGAYLETRNKVASMQAFKDAAAVPFDAAIQEDALFNYAKMAFDLNHDTEGFESYLSVYSNKKRGDDIYSYMALSALYNHDYASAVAAYDKIDELTPDMRSNYMKANYLRANQLISNGSYSDAAPCLKAASFFTDKNDQFNQLARYWLAESYFRTDKFDDAVAVLTDLRNLSALDGSVEGESLDYNLAYCYFQQGNYSTAAKWFDKYLEGSGKTFRKDAGVRRADCDFMRRDYANAIKAYEKVVGAYPATDDLYPRYQLGLAYGLTGRKEMKASVLSAARTADPSINLYPEALYELGRAYVDIGHQDDAVSAFKLLAANSRDNTYVARAFIELGLISRNRADYDGALKYYKKVVEEMPLSGFKADALLAIESIYQSKGEPEVYIAYVDGLGTEGVKSESEKEQIYFNSAEQVFLSGNCQKAIVSMEKYLNAYPQGKYAAQAWYYMAESQKALGSTEKACASYAKVIDAASSGSFRESALLNYAALSYSLERYKEAYEGYGALRTEATLQDNVYTGKLGMMRSAYRAKDYRNAIGAADVVFADERSGSDVARESEYIKAKSLLATSRREEAFDILAALSKSPATAEGAEATYLIIQDTFDRGEFDSVQDLVYKFSPESGSQSYWLAKCFIVLGDAFMEKGNVAQARATFESVRDGYQPSGDDDDVQDNIAMRLQKLNQMSK